MDPPSAETEENKAPEQKAVFEEPSEDRSEETRKQRFQAWAEHTNDILQGSFDTLKFCGDFLEKDVISVMGEGEERLLTMVGEYPATERGTANRNQLNMEETEFAEFCSRAMNKFCNFDFQKLHEAEIGVLRNSFQASDPTKYPETDLMLQMSFDVLGCIDSVVEMIANGEIGQPPQLDQATLMTLLQQALGNGGGGGEGNEIDLSSLQIGDSKEGTEDSKAEPGSTADVATTGTPEQSPESQPPADDTSK